MGYRQCNVLVQPDPAFGHLRASGGKACLKALSSASLWQQESYAWLTPSRPSLRKSEA